MPRATSTKDDEKAPLMVAVTSYASDALPGLGVVRQGTRLRADHPAVAAYPTAWIDADASEDEIWQRQVEIGHHGPARAA